jgi:phage terminase large subunit GpA-like protein
MTISNQGLNELRKAMLGVFTPDDADDIVVWLERHIKAIPYSPIPGPFRCSETPWLADVLRACVDPEFQLVCIQAPIQSGKSLVLELLTAYIAAKSPSPMLLLQDNDANAKDWMTTRLMPLWERCAPVRERLPDGSQGRNDTVLFSHSTAWCLGAYNLKNLQRRSIRYIIGDECWLWPKGHMAEATARVTAFKWLGKRIFASQGGFDGDDFTETFKTTDQREWTYCCPHCNTRQPYKWENIIYPEEARTPDGWNYALLRTETTLQCEGCKVRFKDSDATRNDLNATGKFVALNGNSAHSNVGFHWNGICCRPWGELAEACARASNALNYLGDEEPRKLFKQKQLALPWSDEPEALAGEVRAGLFKMQEQWDKEACFDLDANRICDYEDGKRLIPVRVMSVDVQRNGFYCLVRSWSATGESRLFYWAFVQTWQDVFDTATKCQVPPKLVVVDCGDQAETVHRMCAKNGWMALRGTSQPDFTHPIRRGNEVIKIMRPYSPNEFVNYGGMSRMVKFGNLPMKDMLFRLRRNNLHSYPADAGSEYEAQMTSEYRAKTKIGKPEWKKINNRANHLWDCEVMNLIPALMLRLIGAEASLRDSAEEANQPEQPQ